MTKFKGMLLFDFPDPPIGQWNEEVGTRGMYDLWYFGNTKQFLMIEPYEELPCSIHGDECTCEEVWLGDDKTGNCTTVGTYDGYEEALEEAKRFMRAHPKGWMGEFT